MLTLSEDSRSVDRLGNAIRAYKLASGRTLAFAMIKTGRELAYALHKETAKIAPSEAKLLQLPEEQGWRIKRQKGSAMEEIYRRIRHRKFAAAGWLPAIRGFVRTDTVTTFNKRLGAVLAQVDLNGRCHIQLINRAGPIAKVMSKFGILRKAINDVFRGFAPYIKRKLGDEARKAFWKL
jgi:hypothetical protein